MPISLTSVNAQQNRDLGNATGTFAPFPLILGKYRTSGVPIGLFDYDEAFEQRSLSNWYVLSLCTVERYCSSRSKKEHEQKKEKKKKNKKKKKEKKKRENRGITRLAGRIIRLSKKYRSYLL